MTLNSSLAHAQENGAKVLENPFVKKMEITDQNGNREEYTCYGEGDFLPADRARFLAGVGKNDQLKIRWIGFSGGEFPLLFSNNFRLVVEPLVTWSGWQSNGPSSWKAYSLMDEVEGNYLARPIRLDLPEGTTHENENLGELHFPVSRVIDVVENEGPTGEDRCYSDEIAGFKIAVNVSRGYFKRGLGLSIYFDFQELLNAPNLTKRFVASGEDGSSATFEVQLIKGKLSL